MKRIGLLGLILLAGLLPAGCRQYDPYWGDGGYRYKPEFNINYLNYFAPDEPAPLDLHELAR